MAKIRFIVDYRGTLTGEEWFPAGAVVDRDNATALVAAGRAEYVAEKPELIEPIGELDPLPDFPPVTLAVDLEGLTVKELRGMAKEAGVPGYRKLKKADLIAELQDD